MCENLKDHVLKMLNLCRWSYNCTKLKFGSVCPESHGAVVKSLVFPGSNFWLVERFTQPSILPWSVKLVAVFFNAAQVCRACADRQRSPKWTPSARVWVHTAAGWYVPQSRAIIFWVELDDRASSWFLNNS